MEKIRVEVFRSIGALEPYGAAIDEVNRASRRPCPFATFEYLRTFVEHDEFATGGEEPLVLLAFDGPALVGYLPLCRRPHRVLGTRIGLLVWHDTDRPHAVARPQDEARCCEAFYRYLLDEERGWTLLELEMQDGESALEPLPRLAPWRHHGRHFPSMPNTTIPFPVGSLPAYLETLGSSSRRNVARFSRRLLAATRIETLGSRDPVARRPLLELYLDVERRSWKQAAAAGIGRDPRRVAFFRALCAPGQPMALDFHFVLADGVPISGVICGVFGDTFYGLETAYDAAWEDLRPGYLTTITALDRALAAGARAYNLDGNYAYYKARWGGVVTETRSVQIFRVPSLRWLRALAGEARRRLTPPPPPMTSNPARADDAAEPRESDHRASPEVRARVDALLAEVSATGARVDRLGGAALEARLPFAAKRQVA